MSLLNMMQKKSRLMIWQTALAVLSVFSMTSMAALLQFDVHALSGTLSASPSSCSVGDTITLTTEGGVQGSTYHYSYKIDNGSSISLTGYISDSSYEFIPTKSGTYLFNVMVGGVDYWQTTSNEVVVSSESSDESSEESSEESSAESSAESSFSPMQWLPGWEGQQYVQPSADSTPTLELSLPSDVQFSVSDGIGGVLSSAFQAFPAPLLGVIIPSVICLFIGWWLHK